MKTASAAPRSVAQATGAQAFVDLHRDLATDELFGIAQLCKEFDITPRALRFYEDKGLLSPRRINTTRVYTRRDRARLALILRAKAIGSPLAEIKRFLDLYGNHGEGRDQQIQYVITRTDHAIAELEQKRERIEETLAELRLINTNCKSQLHAREIAIRLKLTKTTIPSAAPANARTPAKTAGKVSTRRVGSAATKN